MKQRPILFNTEMVQAILAGRKTQTRREVKISDHQPTSELVFLPSAYPHFQFKAGNMHWQVECPFGKKGDVLWVRETHLVCHHDEFLEGFDSRVIYKASVHSDWYQSLRETHSYYKWMPSIHMNKVFARIWLRITDVRVERLQLISDADIRKEGAAEFGCVSHWLNWKDLWTSVNGEKSWEANPWVWVLEFERIEKPN